MHDGRAKIFRIMAAPTKKARLQKHSFMPRPGRVPTFIEPRVLPAFRQLQAAFGVDAAPESHGYAVEADGRVAPAPAPPAAPAARLAAHAATGGGTGLVNLYEYDGATGSFAVRFAERGTKYGDAAPTRTEIAHTLALPPHRGPGAPGRAFHFRFLETEVEKWGVNFAATLQVLHPGRGVAGSFLALPIYLPGVRTYDPAGATGDRHASERVGASCAVAQAMITIAQLAAAALGAGRDGVGALQGAFADAVRCYHGRDTLFAFMHAQVVAACFDQVACVSYPDFIRARVERAQLDLCAGARARAHTQTYLLQGPCPCVPPPAYHLKVAQKDDVEALFAGDGEGLAAFRALLPKPEPAVAAPPKPPAAASTGGGGDHGGDKFLSC